MPLPIERNSKPSINRFAILFVIASIGILIARLLISVSIDSNAYEIVALSKMNDDIRKDADFLNEKLQVMGSPQFLAQKAYDMGMRENTTAMFMRLSDGKILGGKYASNNASKNNTVVANDAIKILG